MGWKFFKVFQILVIVKEENVVLISQFLYKFGVLNIKINMKMIISEVIKIGIFDFRVKCLIDIKNQRELLYEEACQSGLILRDLKQELGKFFGILNVLIGRLFIVLEFMQKGVFDFVYGIVRDYFIGKYIFVYQAVVINIIIEDIVESFVGFEVSVIIIIQL